MSIERVREVMSWLDGWDSNRSAASFKGFQSITLGDIRALLDELSRLRRVESAWISAASYGDGSPMMTPERLIKTLQSLMEQRDAARVLSEREGQDG